LRTSFKIHTLLCEEYMAPGDDVALFALGSPFHLVEVWHANGPKPTTLTHSEEYVRQTAREARGKRAVIVSKQGRGRGRRPYYSGPTLLTSIFVGTGARRRMRSAKMPHEMESVPLTLPRAEMLHFVSRFIHRGIVQ
jgi:hypothetical protein